MFWFSPLFALLVLIPAVKLLRRAGFSGWLAALLLVPFVNVAFLWWLAFADSARRFAVHGHGGHSRHCGPGHRRRDADDASDATAAADSGTAPTSPGMTSTSAAPTRAPQAAPSRPDDGAAPSIILPA